MTNLHHIFDVLFANYIAIIDYNYLDLCKPKFMFVVLTFNFSF